MQSNWRDNPNLRQCFEDCVEMFRAISFGFMPAQETPTEKSDLRLRREALGINQVRLSELAGTHKSLVSYVECHNCGQLGARRKIEATLDRLEAERQQGDSP